MLHRPQEESRCSVLCAPYLAVRCRGRLACRTTRPGHGGRDNHTQQHQDTTGDRLKRECLQAGEGGNDHPNHRPQPEDQRRVSGHSVWLVDNLEGKRERRSTARSVNWRGKPITSSSSITHYASACPVWYARRCPFPKSSPTISVPLSSSSVTTT